jgi:hypothetical protein
MPAKVTGGMGEVWKVRDTRLCAGGISSGRNNPPGSQSIKYHGRG